MKKILFLITSIVLLSCNNEQKSDTQLQGDFKYTAYYWNDASDSVGIHLVHYLDIDKKGNYKLILRNDAGSAGYYYGYVDNELLAALVSFVADTSYKKEYLSNDSASAIYNGPTYKFDFVNSSGERKITFIPPQTPEAMKQIQAKLDSLIHTPGKKQSSFFNIDNYLKSIIKEDSAGRLHPPPAKR